MTLQLPLSVTGPADAFAAAVEAHRTALEAHRSGKPGYSMPVAPHPLLDALVTCTPRPDPLPAEFTIRPYEIFDDGPTLADRKAALLGALNAAAAATRDAILSPARRQVLSLDMGDALVIPEDSRTPAQVAAVAAYVAFEERAAEIQRNAAHVAVEIEDLPEAAVATWKVPEL